MAAAKDAFCRTVYEDRAALSLLECHASHTARHGHGVQRSIVIVHTTIARPMI